MLMKQPSVLIKSCLFKGHRIISGLWYIYRGAEELWGQGENSSFLEFSYAFLYVQRHRALKQVRGPICQSDPVPKEGAAYQGEAKPLCSVGCKCS